MVPDVVWGLSRLVFGKRWKKHLVDPGEVEPNQAANVKSRAA